MSEAVTESESTVVCPHCGRQQTVKLLSDRCLWFHECENCKKLLSPKRGDCCVPCSFGTPGCDSKACDSSAQAPEGA